MSPSPARAAVEIVSPLPVSGPMKSVAQRAVNTRLLAADFADFAEKTSFREFVRSPEDLAWEDRVKSQKNFRRRSLPSRPTSSALI
jgi:hypothetical protein